MLPLLVFPLLVINALGSADGAVYFISFQIVTLLNAVILAVANSMYAESERATSGRRHLVRSGGLTLIVCSAAGAVVMFVLAPYFLQIFGAHYVERGHLDPAGAVASPPSPPRSTTGARSGCAWPATSRR